MVEEKITNQLIWNWQIIIAQIISIRKLYSKIVLKNYEVITQFNSFFDRYAVNNLGIPGSGKTSAMIYLVNKMRNAGKKVYYINLRVEDSQGNVLL